MREIVIHGRKIADDEPCYVIAEIGHNHQGNYATARDMIRKAALCGVDAVKFQKRDVDTLYSESLLNSPYENENSFGRTYGEHRRVLEFGAKEYLACRAVAVSAKVDFFATAFDEASADFLMMVDVPAIKIASGGLTDDALLSHCASLGKPLIVSTGGADWDQVDHAVELLTGYPTPFALLHCTAAYPVLQMAELNLLAIRKMRERYPDIVIGWSGHDPGIAMAYVAYAYGARIIEKHFTLNRAMKGTDHSFSLEPRAMQVMCEDLKKVYVASGDGEKRMYESERQPLAKMRRQRTTFGSRITGQMYVCH